MNKHIYNEKGKCGDKDPSIDHIERLAWAYEQLKQVVREERYGNLTISIEKGKIVAIRSEQTMRF